MNIYDIRRKLAGGQATVGTWLQLPSADVAEIMAQAGYDWVAVDMEHGSFGSALLPDIFRAIECGGAAPFARLPEATRSWIKFALDAGAEGLVFPMIESRDQLDQAISWATYPGWGTGSDAAHEYRGVGFSRANGFGQFFDGYVRNVASRVFLVAQIEHIRAVQNLEQILGNSRLDAIMVGPYDLSGSMGLTGQFGHPDFREAMDRIATVCRKMGCRMGLHIVNPDPVALRREIQAGCQFIAYGIDSVFLWGAARRPRV